MMLSALTANQQRVDCGDTYHAAAPVHSPRWQNIVYPLGIFTAVSALAWVLLWGICALEQP